MDFDPNLAWLLSGNGKRAVQTMTMYELARVIGVRAEHIARGAPSTVSWQGVWDPKAVAMKELKEKKLPMRLTRPAPGSGPCEEIDVNDMTLPMNVEGAFS